MRIRTTLMRSLAMAALAAAAFAAQATPATSYYVYDESGHVIGEYDQNGNPVQEHIYLGDRPVAVVQNGNATTLDYVTTDQLNTPRVVTDSSQTIEWSWTSDPFGNSQPTGSLTYNLRFPGQYYDAETGHSYNYQRDYDPVTGRYIESDPIGLKGGVNSYRYGYNNPDKYFDNFGLAGCTHLFCIPGFPSTTKTSQLLSDVSRRVGIHDEMAVSPVGGNVFTAAASILKNATSAPLEDCIYQRTRSYLDKYTTKTTWHCVDMCVDCGGPHLTESSYDTYNDYAEERNETESFILQMRTFFPEMDCKLILYDFH